MDNKYNPFGGDPSMPFHCSFEQVELQKLRVGAQVKVCDELLERRSELTSHRDEAMQALIYQLRSYVWSEPEKDHISVSWPADWWQHFKQRWFPNWALKRWPVKMEARRLTAQVIYPLLPQDVPQHVARIVFAVRK